MKAIVLIFALVLAAATSAEAKASCKLPLYIEAVHGVAPNMADNTGDLFLYGLKSAVTLHQGCVVDKMEDAHLDLFITTLKIANNEGTGNSSVISVALAVPLNGIPVYMDDYVLVIRDSDSIDGQVNGLLESIGETLDRHNSPGN